MTDLSRRVDRLEASTFPSRVVVLVADRYAPAREPAAGETLFVVETGVPRASTWGQWTEAARHV